MASFHYKNVTHSHRVCVCVCVCVFLLATAFDGEPAFLSPSLFTLFFNASSRNEEHAQRRNDAIRIAELSKAFSRRPTSDDFSHHRDNHSFNAAGKKRSAAGATSCEAQTRSRYEDVTSRHASRSARHLTFRSSRLPAALSLSLSLSLSLCDSLSGINAMRNCGVPKNSARATDYASPLHLSRSSISYFSSV